MKEIKKAHMAYVDHALKQLMDITRITKPKTSKKNMTK
jgi:hypothetical protein